MGERIGELEQRAAVTDRDYVAINSKLVELGDKLDRNRRAAVGAVVTFLTLQGIGLGLLIQALH